MGSRGNSINLELEAPGAQDLARDGVLSLLCVSTSSDVYMFDITAAKLLHDQRSLREQ